MISGNSTFPQPHYFNQFEAKKLIPFDSHCAVLMPENDTC
ncbi:hypothetical protein D024_2251 [Vibrio parahaemolyticus 3259]|nr:hypothetical protein D024_2251 [Vibrio parahaemolyticus 3259]